jgi:hypothetical protein
MGGRVLSGLALAALVCATASDADARPHKRKKRHHRARAVYVDPNPGTLGLGLIVGGPTGLSGKLYLGDTFAFDFAFGYYYGLGTDDGLGAHADILIHPFVLATTAPFSVPLYFGVGGRAVDDHCRGRRCDNFDDGDDVDVGVRVPFGLALEFHEIPFDFFLEIAVVVDVVDDDGNKVHLDGALGLRYWF